MPDRMDLAAMAAQKVRDAERLAAMRRPGPFQPGPRELAADAYGFVDMSDLGKPETDPVAAARLAELYPEAGAAAPDLGATVPEATRTLPEEPAADGGRKWRRTLGGALQAAAGAIQANVGTTYPGQGFKAALMRGIVGMGAADAAQARLDAATATKAGAWQNRLAMLGLTEQARAARRETPEAAAGRAAGVAGARAKATQPYKIELAKLSASNAMSRALALKGAAVANARDENEARLRAKAWDQALTEGSKAGFVDDEAKLSEAAIRNYENMVRPDVLPKVLPRK